METGVSIGDYVVLPSEPRSGRVVHSACRPRSPCAVMAYLQVGLLVLHGEGIIEPTLLPHLRGPSGRRRRTDHES
jgi:hypothetical protein